MDLFLSILITLFLVGVVLAITYMIVGLIMEKKGSKSDKQEDKPQEEVPSEETPKEEENKE